MDNHPSTSAPSCGHQAAPFSKGIRGLAWFGLVLAVMAGGLEVFLAVATWRDGGMDPYARILVILMLAIESGCVLLVSLAPCALLYAEPLNRCHGNRRSFRIALMATGLAAAEWALAVWIPIHGSC